MQKFLDSSATRFIIGVIAGHVLSALAPMFAAHSIDLWELGRVLAVDFAALLLNGLRPDVDAPGLNWFNPKD